MITRLLICLLLSGLLSLTTHASERQLGYGINTQVGKVYYGDSVLDKGTIFTIRGSKRLNERLFAEIGMGFYSSKQGGTGEIESLSGLSAAARYHYPVIQPIRTSFYLLGGINALKEEGQTHDSSVLFGGGALISINESMFGRFEATGLDNLVLSAGIEKQFDLYKIEGYRDYRYKQDDFRMAPKVTNVKQISKKQIQATLTAAPLTKLYQFKHIKYPDMASHWAKYDTWFASMLTLVKGSQTPYINGDIIDTTSRFNANKLVSRVDAAKMLTVASKLETIYKQSYNPIVVDIQNPRSEEVFVDLIVYRRNGHKVRTIFKDRLMTEGRLETVWNGYSGYGEKVSEGLYDIVLTIKDVNQNQLSMQRTCTRVRKIHTLSYKYEGNGVKPVRDVKPTSNDYNFVRYITAQNLIPAYKVKKDYVFNPDVPMTRIDFFVAVGKILDQHGAKLDPKYNLTYYSDHKQIPEFANKPLRLVMSNLGTGGSDLKRLKPLQMITKAEAVVISNRLLNWIEKHNR